MAQRRRIRRKDLFLQPLFFVYFFFEAHEHRERKREGIAGNEVNGRKRNNGKRFFILQQRCLKFLRQFSFEQHKFSLTTNHLSRPFLPTVENHRCRSYQRTRELKKGTKAFSICFHTLI